MTKPAVLAIDPGNTSGVVVVSLERVPKLLHHEVWKVKAKGPLPSEVVGRLVGEYDIKYAVIEDQYLEKSVYSMKRLTRTSGRWEEACLVHGLDVRWVQPSEWQSKVIGRIAHVRDQIDKVMRMIAFQDTKTPLTADESAAWCLGRYSAVLGCQTRA